MAKRNSTAVVIAASEFVKDLVGIKLPLEYNEAASDFEVIAFYLDRGIDADQIKKSAIQWAEARQDAWDLHVERDEHWDVDDITICSKEKSSRGSDKNLPARHIKVEIYPYGAVRVVICNQ